ncbi:MAG: M23 family metallopeptidase [Bacteroidota bacterium]
MRFTHYLNQEHSNRIIIIQLVLLFSLGLAGCKEEVVPEPFKPRPDHKGYVASLKVAELDKTALGQDWISSAEKALYSATPITSPFSETFYLNPNAALAIGYKFKTLRGQKLMVSVETHFKDSIGLFIDLFRVKNDSLRQYRHVASANKTAYLLGFEPRQDADYILRLQPELLRGGRFTITIKQVPTLEFPVAGKNSRSILSFFGAPRDGGRRVHHGVDIFAKKHTPIIAPVKGRIRRVDTTKLGGRVIWLYDEKRQQNLYFAHLESLYAEQFSDVDVGDTIGTVGKTGNARYTPPHLHFGIYKNGPVDPLAFIKETKTEPSAIVPDTSLVGSWGRITRNSALRASNTRRSSQIDTLSQFDMLKVLGASANYFRVQLPNGTAGYVLGKNVELSAEPIEQFTAPTKMAILETLGDTTRIKTEIDAGASISVMGSFNDYKFIRTPLGAIGWVKGI